VEITDHFTTELNEATISSAGLLNSSSRASTCLKDNDICAAIHQIASSAQAGKSSTNDDNIMCGHLTPSSLWVT